ncbi:MAG: nucleotidyl transferase AbiEii/AbiGii toxin family protein [Actinobacteria bacterium]|nr:nucleotidyl transferase AbiEii/AbiGii toxin family protein [Actinomycetota bacterium]
MTTPNKPLRSTAARETAELALVRVIDHYGEMPAFVVLGGLVPALLCGNSAWRHAGTTDIDVQVDLEIAAGSVDAPRLEKALQAAGFSPGKRGDFTFEGAWRWRTRTADGVKVEVEFDLLADQSDLPANEILKFKGCDFLGAVNLRGTGFASLDVEERSLEILDEGRMKNVRMRVAGLAGFLIAKTAAAYGRGKPKDWYDIAFVLIHNDLGGVEAAIQRTTTIFPDILNGAGKTWLTELRANFADSDCQGVEAYVSQIILDHSELDQATLSGDAYLAVSKFCEGMGLR